MTTTPIVRFGPIWRRFLAFLLDFLFFAIIVLVSGWLAVALLRALNFSDAFINLTVFTLMAIMVFGYYACFWHEFGATPARIWLKLRVVDLRDPNRLGLSWPKSILRMLFGYWLNSLLEGLGFWWMFLSPQRQTWFDRVSKTVMLYVPNPNENIGEMAAIPQEKKRVLVFAGLLFLSVLAMIIQIAKIILLIFPE